MGILSLGKDYHKSLLQSLLYSRQDGTLCDVEIHIGGCIVYAHKAVLAACSPYFSTMFTSDFREGNEVRTVTDLTEVFDDDEAVDRVITSFYTGKLPITIDDMCDTYRACSYFMCDQAKTLCQKFMNKHLDVETSLPIWAITDNADDMAGDLHSAAAAVLKNRFHDYVLYQEEALELSEAQIPLLLKDNVFFHCSPRQIITYLLKWLVRHGEEKIETFDSVLRELSLPPVSDPTKTIQVIDDHLSSAGFSEFSRKKVTKAIEQCVCKTRRSSQPSVEARSNSTVPEEWEMDDKWSLETLSHHLPNVPMMGTNEDALVVLSPRYNNGIQRSDGNVKKVCPEEQPGVELKICAYLIKSKRWIDIGNAEIPYDGVVDRINVCNFDITVCREFLYLHNDGSELYRLSLIDKTWEVLNPEYADDGMVMGKFAIEVGGTLYLVIVRDIEEKKEIYNRRGRQTDTTWDIRTVVSLWMVDMEDDSMVEVLECPDELLSEKGITFGPCFSHDGYIFLRMRTDNMSKPKHGCLNFDVTTATISFEPFTTALATMPSDTMCFMHSSKKPRIDNALTMTKGDWVYQFSDDKNVFERISKDGTRWISEPQDVVFPSSFYPKATQVFNVTLQQSIPIHVDVPLGSGLYRFINSKKRNMCGQLLEVNIAKPGVVTEHTPPSSDVVIGASYTTLPMSILSKFPLAKFEYVEENLNRDQEKMSMYEKSLVELPR